MCLCSVVHWSVLCLLELDTCVRVLPLSISVSLQPAAMKMGLRSDMGLAVMIFPPTAWNHKNVNVVEHKCGFMDWNVTFGTHRYVAYLQPAEPAQLFQDSEEDFGLMRRKRHHLLFQHPPHVAESARRTKHYAWTIETNHSLSCVPCFNLGFSNISILSVYKYKKDYFELWITFDFVNSWWCWLCLTMMSKLYIFANSKPMLTLPLMIIFL